MVSSTSSWLTSSPGHPGPWIPHECIFYCAYHPAIAVITSSKY